MARGLTLVKLLDNLRTELKASLNPAHNNQVRDKQIAFLQSTQEWLWDDFTWPHLRVQRNYQLQAGQYLYDVGADFDIDRIEKIEVKDGGVWRRLVPGIDSSHYAAHDTELDQRSWPIRRWRIAENEDIEVWPKPDTNGTAADLEGYFKVTGIRRLRPLVEDGDRCDLDGQLIYLYAAAKASPETQEGKFALNLANKRLARLKANLTPRRQFKMFGIGRCEGPSRMFVGQFRPPGT
jgi:hypothetical protein